MYDSEKYSVFKIGSVESVDGRTVKVRVDKNKNSSHFLFKGELLKNVSVGGFVKVIKGFIPIIASVESEYIIEDKQLADSEYTSKSSQIVLAGKNRAFSRLIFIHRLFPVRSAGSSVEWLSSIGRE